MESYLSGSGSGSISFDESDSETQPGPPVPQARTAQDRPPIGITTSRSPTGPIVAPPQAQSPARVSRVKSPVDSYGSVSFEASADDSLPKTQAGFATRPTPTVRTAQVRPPVETAQAPYPPTRAPAEAHSRKADFMKSMFHPGSRIESERPQDRIYGRDDLIYARHETVFSIFDAHGDQYNKLMGSENIGELKSYIAENFSKVVWLDFLKEKLRLLVDSFATDEQRELMLKNDWNIDTMLRILGAILEENKRNIALMDISFEIPERAEEIGVAIDRCRKRTSEVINELQSTIRNQQDEIGLMKNEMLAMRQLQAELQAAKNHILMLQGRLTVSAPTTQQEFMQELQYRLYAHENLNSSLQDELEQEMKAKETVLNKYLESEAKRLNDQNQQLLEIAETVKDLEMQDIFRDAVIEKIRSLTTNPSEVNKAVNEWLRTIHDAIQNKSDKLFKMTKELETLNRRSAHVEISRQKQLEHLTQMETKTEQLITRKQDEILKKHGAIQEADEQLKSLNEEYEAWFKALETRNEEVIKLKQDHATMTKFYKDMLAKQEEFRARYPTLLPRFTTDLTARRSLTPIVESASRSIAEETDPKSRGPQGFRERLRAKADFAKFVAQKHRDRLRSENLRRMFTPERTSRALSPGYVDEQMDSMLQSQRIPPVPRTPSFSPPSDIPIVQITPPSPIETSQRTSDTAFPFETQTPFTRTVVLTSPKTEEPLLVNIGVDPKPLTDTESGEVFTCDISVGIQPGSHDMLPQIPAISSGSPDTSYHLNVPPEVPPFRSRQQASTSRRHFAADDASMRYY